MQRHDKMKQSSADFLSVFKMARQRNHAGFHANLVASAQYFPLISAIFAPISTLLDIPGLSQAWFTDASTLQPYKDVSASLVLSALGLAFNLVANIMLVLRFTVDQRYWHLASRLSVLSWIIKLVFALVNLGVYGTRKPANAIFAEGFWCQVLSVILSGCIAILLVAHMTLRGKLDPRTGEDIRVAGARFILSVMVFVGLIALQALIFSRIESWTYLDGIYFSIVTCFTIGFGDFEPTHTATRVLNFPFAVLSITLLAVMLSQLVSFMQSRAKKRRARFHRAFEEEFTKSRETADDEKQLSLVVEISELQRLEAREERIDQMINLFMSATSLVVFWVVGAAIFSAIEGWSYGIAMYFCYVFFLTTGMLLFAFCLWLYVQTWLMDDADDAGYGDYAPSTPAGRVVFIVYSLLAVPLVTNFVLQTVSGGLTGVADTFAQHAADKRAPSHGESKRYHSHAWYVEHARKRLNAIDHSDQNHLTQVVLALACRLEAQSRSLLIETLEPGSKAQLLLRADRALQRRVIARLEDKLDPRRPTLAEKVALQLEREEREERELEEQDDDHIRNLFHNPDETNPAGDVLQRVGAYRQTFAALLVSGSELLQLKGHTKSHFERALEGEIRYDKGGLLLGSGRQGPAEEAEGIDV